MKAAVYYQTGAPDVFRYEEIPDPACPRDGVVVQVEAVSIEGGDVLNRAGGALTGKPHVVGYQCAGTIREIGPSVTDRRPGQRVVCVMPHGSHAERAAVPVAATWVLPEGLDLRAGACVPIPFGTADDCLFEFGQLRPRESVLIQAGGGGVGLAAIQLARKVGARVAATASSDDKLARLKSMGVDLGINYSRDDFVTAVREWTGGQGADLVVDSVGGHTLAKSIEAARYRGRIITVGGAGRDPHPPDLLHLAPGNRSLTGVFLGAELALRPDRVHPMIERHLAQAARGELEVVIDCAFPLREAAEAHRYLESRRAFGRVLLIP